MFPKYKKKEREGEKKREKKIEREREREKTRCFFKDSWPAGVSVATQESPPNLLLPHLPQIYHIYHSAAAGRRLTNPPPSKKKKKLYIALRYA